MTAMRKRRFHGEDYLRNVESITIVLDDGTHAIFNLADEIAIPDDPVEMQRELGRSVARYAFWAYQAERAARVMRERERDLAVCEAENNLIYRKHYEVQLQQAFTEGLIKACVTVDSQTRAAAEGLTSARHHYNIINAIRESVNHRIFVLRQLTAAEARAHSP